MRMLIISAVISILSILFVVNFNRIARTEKFSIEEKELLILTVYESKSGIALLLGLFIFFYSIIGLWVLPILALTILLFYYVFKKRISKLKEAKEQILREK